MSSTWIHAAHVDYLDQHLVALAARELRRAGYLGLIIEEPPRVGKSTLTSQYFPAWYMGTFPDHRVMLGSYEANFASSWGEKVRDTIEEFGPAVFGVEVSQSSSAKDRWNLKDHKGGMTTAGVCGKFTGMGAHLMILDDVIKNAADADSETYREKIWNWYKTTILTRLEPDAIMCICMTRWHEDDLIGRILKEMESDPDAPRFLRIRLPALAEGPNDIPDDEEYVPDPLGRAPGEILFPERLSLTMEPGKINIGGAYAAQDRTWFALYQQRPTQQSGNLFDPSSMKVIPRHEVPKLKKVVRRWDMAATEEGEGYDPDWTVGAKVGIDESGCFYILDIARFREGPAKTERRVKETVHTDGRAVKQRMEQEPGSSGKSVISHYRRKVLPGYDFRGRRSTGDKKQRAGIFASRAEQGDVYIVQGPWNAEFVKECRRFPNGAHDDQVDAVSGALDDLVGAAGRTMRWS